MPEQITVGTRVAYSDMANPLRFGVVESVSVDAGAPSPYRIRWEEGDDCFTDLRQHGWKVGPEAERLAAVYGVWPESAGLVGAAQ